MAKGGKLTKLKSAIKKLHSMSKLGRTNSTSIVAAADDNSFTGESKTSSEGLHPVFVGKSRRRYLISSEIIDHPLFQELADKSEGEVTVACEVVLFEHLLWMLENADSQLESMDELVEFYSC